MYSSIPTCENYLSWCELLASATVYYPISVMADYDQLPQNDSVPQVFEPLSPIEKDIYSPLSSHQDVSQTWLAYDKAANGSWVPEPSQLVDGTSEETRYVIIEGMQARHY